MSYKSPFPQQGAGIGLTKPAPLIDTSSWSTAAQRFAPGNFVETWNPELGRMAIGITRAIKDPFEANPVVLVRWLHDFTQEGVRAEYLNVLNAGG